jgi:hypothetical protein
MAAPNEIAKIVNHHGKVSINIDGKEESVSPGETLTVKGTARKLSCEVPGDTRGGLQRPPKG